VLDQRLLPAETKWTRCESARDVAKTIIEMQVRGAPAIGAAAAYGCALEGLRSRGLASGDFRIHMLQTMEMLAATRPTAVNLFWALERMTKVLVHSSSVVESVQGLVTEADVLATEDVKTNKQMGYYGATLFGEQAKVLTHCNTGSLATFDYGTALGVIRSLHETGRLQHVWVGETRPFLQGSRLTAFELQNDGIPYTLITDSMAGHFMKMGQVDGVVVGADRIAANGDTANKIGTYSLAVLCSYHKIPFYIASPISTFDLHTPSGDFIPIEERSAHEVTHIGTFQIAPTGAKAAHPAFDVTPHALITAIITERGIIMNPNETRVRALVETGGNG